MDNVTDLGFARSDIRVKEGFGAAHKGQDIVYHHFLLIGRGEMYNRAALLPQSR